MRLLLVLGIIGGATWIAYAFVPAECAPATNRTLIFCNRLWTPALFAMTVGFLGLLRWATTLGSPRVTRWLSIAVIGAAFMTFGNFAEFWVFFGWPQQGPDGWLRNSLWVTDAIGLLGLLLASFGAGLVLLLGRVSLRIRVLGAILVTVPCLMMFIGPLAVGVLAITTGLFVLVAEARPPREPAVEPA
jgi:hypothetical protein